MTCLWLIWLGLWGQGLPAELPELVAKEEGFLSPPHARALPAHRFGSNPFKIRPLADSGNWLVLARGRDQVWVCDADFRVIAKRSAPAGPVAWSIYGDWLFVAGERSGVIARYTIKTSGLGEPKFFDLPPLTSARDLVADPDHHALWITDPFESRLLRVALAESTGEMGEVDFWPMPPGPHDLIRHNNLLAVNLMWRHRIKLIPLANGMPDFDSTAFVANDGNFWSMAIFEKEGEAWLVACGIEDHPLERTGGGFGYVDSFLFLYRLAPTPQRVAAFNLSAIGVVTPKALRFDDQGLLWVAGYGSAAMAAFRVQAGQTPGFDHLKTYAVLPGISDFAAAGEGEWVAVSPLLDRIMTIGAGGVRRHQKMGEDKRDWPSKIGEMLLFTTAIAPGNQTQGGNSRFTCEACHFEGGIDGRVHFTGRDQTYATPKPLRGLANSVPLFSSGGDDTLAKMTLAEFEVANQGKAHFSLETQDHPWLQLIEGAPETLTPQQLRIALIRFLFDFEHETNPWLLRQGRLNVEAKAGLAVFRDRCEACHQAVPTTRTGEALPFEHWAARLEAPGDDLVWANPFYYKTGITPYFDPAGTQVPSLRRIFARHPYFTDGSAATLEEVLRAFRYQDNQVWHRAPEGTGVPLDDLEIQQLLILLKYF